MHGKVHYRDTKVLGCVEAEERWCRGGFAAARRSSEPGRVAECGGRPCSASLVVRPSVDDALLLCKARGQDRRVGVVPASGDFGERLTVAEIHRRGGAKARV